MLSRPISVNLLLLLLVDPSHKFSLLGDRLILVGSVAKRGTLLKFTTRFNDFA